MKIHFITFANSKMEKSRDRIVEQAKGSGFFDCYHIFGENELPKEMVEYCRGKLGFGHWIWKPYIINKVLKEIQEKDILIWIDAGCTIQKEGRWRFDEYIDLTNKSEYGNVSFELSETYCTERRYTKADIFKHFDAEDLIEGTQLNTTAIFLKNIYFTRRIVDMWEDAMLNHRHLSEDNECRLTEENHVGFFDNRQDQSIFSIIRRKYGTTIIPHPIQNLSLLNSSGNYIVPTPFFSELEANCCGYNSSLVGFKLYPIVATRLRY